MATSSAGVKTVHIIANSHIDPIWLWPWQAGLDAILNTCRSVCDLLDKNHDVIFTCGEAWKYVQIQRCSPELFARVKAHILAGRWETIGWWIQPDCNLPSAWAMRRQIALGKEYFQQEFGSFSRIGYNVDSFGHAAALPGLMQEAGQDAYIMMRPQQHEMPMTSPAFRWRGYADGPEVLTFRIPVSYGDWGDRDWRIKECLKDLPEGVHHTMCFFGVGDHGGGPSQQMIDWCREHADAFAGAKLVFSSPSRFFAALAEHRERLPLITGEMQMHAVGCYSVYRPIKLAVRQAEHVLQRAELVATPEDAPRMSEAWKHVCFNHFHDTLGGTCIPSAYPQPEAQLGVAMTTADDILMISLRREMVKLGPDPLQRVVIWNASDTPYDGYVAYEPWTEGRAWNQNACLLDERGELVPYQTTQPEGAVTFQARLMFQVALEAGQTKIVRIDFRPTAARVLPPSGIQRRNDELVTAQGYGVRLAGCGAMELAGAAFTLPHLELLEDSTDTWSHGADRYIEGPASTSIWSLPVILDSGPLFGSILRCGQLGRSQVTEEWRLYAGQPYVELLLRVTWAERQQVLKLVWPFLTPITSRIDGVMGETLPRALDAIERPLRDFTLLELALGTDDAPPRRVGVVCPEVYALDATPYRARFTLLRSPLMAHHEPRQAASSPRTRVADHGVHEFRFRFFVNPTAEDLNQQAMILQRPPLIGEWTAGMQPAK